ncbi:hypothetical protein BDY24DRAFT_382269 [Mrakia frigida]|uniref:Pxp2p n=1 Tax=Mrakia frigida TaxID=29902 RepID=UPI003FCC1C0E
MSTTPFFTLLAHLLALNANHSDPFSLYGPLLCSVLSRLNEPELIAVLFDDLCERLEPVGDGRIPDWIGLIGKDTKDGLSEKSMAKLVVAVRIREALLKSFPLIGFPLTISSLTSFSTHLSTSHLDIWPSILQIESLHPFPTAFEPLDPRTPLHNPVEDKNAVLEDVSRGRKLFNSIYGKVAGRVIESLRWGHPNLVDCALKLIYTPVLSDLRILQEPLDSSLLCLVLCFSSDLPPQTKGHFRGAQNHQATDEQLCQILSSVRGLMEWTGQRLRLERMEFVGKTEGFSGRR